MSEPALSVVIPALGAEGALPRVLAGLAAQRLPPGDAFELVVGLDAAATAAAERALGELLATQPYPARIVRGSRPGASANRNAGARAGRARLVLFIDDDTIPAPPMLGEHLAWHRSHPQPEVAVLGLVRWAPELRVTPFMRWLDRGVQFDYPHVRGIEAGWGRFYSANVSLDREWFLGLDGGFDEVRFPFGYEDLDLGLRADREGMRLLLNRAAVADHLRPMSPAMWQRRVRRIALAERRFGEVHPEIEPWFKRSFEHAAAQPPARGRGRLLAGLVPPELPWLGPRVWTSTDLYFRQLLAPAFLEAWETAADPAAGPDLSERRLGG